MVVNSDHKYTFFKKTRDAYPVISKLTKEKLYESSKRFFSHNFQTLLKHFCLMISETEELLFFTFLLIENMFFESTR